ncbi:MAG: hypothetical protein R3227_02865 [Reinekea sp.]|nr:hypothetical protein [Reinekea sp.]
MKKLFFLLLVIPALAYAGGKHHHDHEVTIVEVTEVTEVTEVIQVTNLSPVTQDFLKATATSIAAGSHQFDYSTSDWQVSVTSALQVEDNGENGFSFGVAKRLTDNGLFHFSYTPDGSDDWIQFGGTFRIGN